MLRPELSLPLLRAESSGIREIALAARLTPGAIRLDTGEPNFRTPQHIGNAGKRAIDNGLTHYTDTQGVLPLRQELSLKLNRVNGVHAKPEEIVCGPGGVGILAAALAAVVSAGDEILLPDPGWPNTSIMARWLGADEVRYTCDPATGFLPDLEGLKRAITRKTKVLLVNSPNNPTGTIYPPAVLAELAAIAEQNNLWVMSDECYDQIVFTDAAAAPSMASLVDRSRLILAYTFSKTYAMTGWRLGYGVVDVKVADSMVKFLQSTSSSVSSITQWAGLEALQGPQDCVTEMVGAYQRRRDLAVALLSDAGVLISKPEGAFYVLADVSASGFASREFALELLHEDKVSVSPGSAFGQVANSAVRLSLASSDKDLIEGIKRLCRFIERRSPKRPPV